MEMITIVFCFLAFLYVIPPDKSFSAGNDNLISIPFVFISAFFNFVNITFRETSIHKRVKRTLDTPANIDASGHVDASGNIDVSGTGGRDIPPHKSQQQLNIQLHQLSMNSHQLYVFEKCKMVDDDPAPQIAMHSRLRFYSDDSGTIVPLHFHYSIDG